MPDNLLLIDNYDSFTFNLYHYLQDATDQIDVIRNDKIDLIDVEKYDAIVLSPGPGLPEEAGICLDIIRNFYTTKKILGVCLGHQAIALAFGGRLKNLNSVMHGLSRPTLLTKKNDVLFKGIPNVFDCARYHSWVVDKTFLPDTLEELAHDEQGEIMALKHKQFPIYGLQFHPESVMTPFGKTLLRNWMNIR
ncbi:MAG: Aminodeoxychorismate synthase component 2 [Bacteroidetes bacterium ADurb.Bin408]|nr:MAG: Aminodeoxychorismate synthase component 2 [Bacteroidetes bacterium ADurb.Bin408]